MRKPTIFCAKTSCGHWLIYSFNKQDKAKHTKLAFSLLRQTKQGLINPLIAMEIYSEFTKFTRSHSDKLDTV